MTAGIGLAVGCGLSCFSGTLAAQDLHLGLIEYEIACMPCHGLEGRGDGVLASKVPAAPPDLTQISKANVGRFPRDRIARIVDGREQVAGHRRTTMPVWGERYRRRVEGDETRAAIDKRARDRIEALVAFIESIQRK